MEPIALPPDRELAALRARISASQPDLLAELEHLVNLDSGSYTRDGVNLVAAWAADRLARLGGAVTRHADPAGRLGDTVEAVFTGEPGGPRALLIGHTDTVFPVGTVAERPFRLTGGVATGPGVTDMKAGLITLVHGLEATLAVGRLPFERLTVIANPDEEIGSPTSTWIAPVPAETVARQTAPAAAGNAHRDAVAASIASPSSARRSTSRTARSATTLGRVPPAITPTLQVTPGQRPVRACRPTTWCAASRIALRPFSGSTPA